MRNALLPIPEFKLPRQLDLALDFLPTNRISTAERNAVIARLAHMLMEAAGIATKEGGDDGR
jgi:hypothetical protein